MRKLNTKALVFCALFAALTAVCAQIALPIGPVPISLATLAVMLCGAVLGAQSGGIAIAVYILLGLAGVPVFAGFKAASALAGPTGGYIIGYLPYAVLAGLPLARLQRSFPGRCLLLLIGTVICYILGTAWFMHMSGRTLGQSLSLCVWPFLPGDAIKIALAAFLAPRLRTAMKLSIRR